MPIWPRPCWQYCCNERQARKSALRNCVRVGFKRPNRGRKHLQARMRTAKYGRMKSAATRHSISKILPGVWEQKAATVLKAQFALISRSWLAKEGTTGSLAYEEMCKSDVPRLNTKPTSTLLGVRGLKSPDLQSLDPNTAESDLPVLEA
jgi:hypothetical protein